MISLLLNVVQTKRDCSSESTKLYKLAYVLHMFLGNRNGSLLTIFRASEHNSGDREKWVAKYPSSVKKSDTRVVLA